MDRQIVFNGAIPLDTDLLNTNKNVMVGLAMAMNAILGTSTLFSGLACSPTAPASLQVNVAQGSVYALSNVDSTAYGSLGSDTTHQVVKQGIVLGTTTLSCPAPGTTGQSINYLIQAAYQDVDGGSTVLPYYNSSNPLVAYNGPSNSGTSQNTVRQGKCILAVKAGVAATTGSQVTPSADAGYTGLWVVTVANGQTTITSGNISQAAGAPFISETLTQKISQATGDARYLQIGNARTKLAANATYYVNPSTGNDSNAGTSGSPWLTRQHAWNYIQQNLDLVGQYTVTVQLQDGTYTDTFVATGNIPGQLSSSSVVFNGNATTPSNVFINTGSVDCWTASNQAMFQIQNMKIQTSGGTANCVVATLLGIVSLGAGIVFGTAALAHMDADVRGLIYASGISYTISGSAPIHVRAINSSTVTNWGCTVTLTGTPAFSSGFASSLNNSEVYTPSNTYSGSATGVRYGGLICSSIITGGGGANYFPGNSAGSVDSTSSYT